MVFEAFERVQHRRARDQVEQRAPQAEPAGLPENALGGLVVEQNLVIQVTRDDALAERQQDRLEPGLACLAAGALGRHGLDDLAPGGDQFAAERAEASGQVVQRVARRGHQHRAGPGVGQTVRLRHERRHRPGDPPMQQQIGQRRGARERQHAGPEHQAAGRIAARRCGEPQRDRQHQGREQPQAGTDSDKKDPQTHRRPHSVRPARARTVRKMPVVQSP